MHALARVLAYARARCNHRQQYIYQRYPKIENHHTRASSPDRTIDEALAAAPLRLLDVKLHCKSQQHFYMEPQCAWANPDEGGRMRIGSSMQWPNGTQQQVSKVLAIPYVLLLLLWWWWCWCWW